jgi:hypothetical protein
VTRRVEAGACNFEEGSETTEEVLFWVGRGPNPVPSGTTGGLLGRMDGRLLATVGFSNDAEKLPVTLRSKVLVELIRGILVGDSIDVVEFADNVALDSAVVSDGVSVMTDDASGVCVNVGASVDVVSML